MGLTASPDGKPSSGAAEMEPHRQVSIPNTHVCTALYASGLECTHTHTHAHRLEKKGGRKLQKCLTMNKLYQSLRKF